MIGNSSTLEDHQPAPAPEGPGGAVQRLSLAPLAAAAFFAGAIAFVNPALAEECDQTGDLLRAAARNSALTSDAMLALETAVESAMSRHAEGDERGCIVRLAMVRRVLEG